MSNALSTRRELLAVTASAGAALGALFSVRRTGAQPPKPAEPSKPHEHGAPAPGPASKALPPPAPSPTLNAIADSTAGCQRVGRYCLARCTEHLSAGETQMAECQRTVMNMLSVTGALAEIAGYHNANPKLIKALADTCAQFCRACAAACEAHKGHHEECKACFDACITCAKACETYQA